MRGGAGVEAFRETYVLFNDMAMFDDARHFLAMACNASVLRGNCVAG